MRIDRRFLTVVAVSLLWALLVASLFHRWTVGGGSRTLPAREKQIVVATKAVPAGSILNRDSIALRNVPQNMVPAGAFVHLEDVIERPVIGAIQADEPVVEARVAPKGSGMGLGPLIPPGMRALSVRVNDVVGVAGFVLPGMRVDVLVTGRPPYGRDTETRTVLQNISVLSAGQTIQADAKSQPITTPVVTLLVTPREAQSLALANNEGHIQLVLRNSTDQTVTATGGSSLHEIYGSERTEPKPESQRVTAPVHAASIPTHPQRPGRTAIASVPAVVAAEPDQIIVIQGAVKKVEYFPPGQAGK